MSLATRTYLDACSSQPQLADPLAALEVGEQQDMEQFGSMCGAESVQALLDQRLEFVDLHDRMLGGAHEATLSGSEPGASDDPDELDLPREIAGGTQLRLLVVGEPRQVDDHRPRPS